VQENKGAEGWGTGLVTTARVAGVYCQREEMFWEGKMLQTAAFKTKS
jgi:hypothetical protein